MVAVTLSMWVALAGPARAADAEGAYQAARAQAALTLVDALAEHALTEATTLAAMLDDPPMSRLMLADELIAGVDETGRVDGADGCMVSLSASSQQYAASLEALAAHADPTAGPVGSILAALRDRGAPSMEVSAEAAAPQPFWAGLFSQASSGDFEAERHLTGPARAYWSERLTDRERRLMVRNARREALAHLAEIVGDLDVDGTFTIADCLAADRDPGAAYGLLLQPARVAGVRYHPATLVVEVAVDIELVDALAALRSFLKTTDRPVAVDLEDLSQRIVSDTPRTFRGLGQAAPSRDRRSTLPEADNTFLQVVASSPEWVRQTRQASGSAPVEIGEGEYLEDAAARAGASAGHVAGVRLLAEILPLAFEDGRTVQDHAAEDRGLAVRLLVLIDGLTAETDTIVVNDDVMTMMMDMDLYDVWLEVLAERLYDPPTVPVVVRPDVEDPAAEEPPVEGSAAEESSAEETPIEPVEDEAPPAEESDPSAEENVLDLTDVEADTEGD
jgi:hypothetical protein